MSSFSVFPRCRLSRRRNILIAASKSSEIRKINTSAIYQQTLEANGLTHWHHTPHESWRSLATLAELLRLSMKIYELEISIRHLPEASPMSRQI